MLAQPVLDDPPKVLIVEDNFSHARLMRAALRKLDVTTEFAGTEDAAIRILQEEEFDLVLLDINLSDGDGFRVQRWIAENGVSSSIVFVTADSRVELAVRALKTGAADYVVKRPDYLDQLVDAAEEAIRSCGGPSHVPLDLPVRTIARSIIGWSSPIVETRRRVAEYAGKDHAVLLVGEPGTGRSVVSRTLHVVSQRPGLFVVAHAREISERIANEAADADAVFLGLLESAHSGTIVIEGVTSASLQLQSAILSAVEANSAPAVRLIIEAECDPALSGFGERFSRALWDRLCGYRIDLSPIRERKEDIRPLASRELARLGIEAGRGRLAFDDEAWERLRSHNWSGNVRELLACVRAVVAASEGKQVFDRYDVEAAILETQDRFTSRSQHEQKERARLKAALDRHGWNVTATARTLEVSRGWLRRRIEWFEL